MYKNGEPDAKHLGLIIKEARQRKGLKQEALAEKLDVSDRAVRNWESGADVPILKNKNMLVDILSISPELLGLQQRTDYTLEETDRQIAEAKISLNRGDFTTALSTLQIMEPHITKHGSGKNVEWLERLAVTNYLLGHVISITYNDPPQASKYYQKMARYARDLKDPNLSLLAYTYQGEMLRRMDKPKSALRLLTSINPGLDVDKLVKGNYFQLTARLYASIKELTNAERVLQLAEDMACSTDRRTSGIHVCFNQCSVYEEGAKMYLSLEKPDFERSFAYIEKAEKHLPNDAQRWLVPVLLTKGEILIRDALLTQSRATNKASFHDGTKLFGKGLSLAHEYGHERQIYRARLTMHHIAEKRQDYIDVYNAFNEMINQYPSKN